MMMPEVMLYWCDYVRLAGGARGAVLEGLELAAETGVLKIRW